MESSYLSLSTAIFGKKSGPEPTEADFKSASLQAALKKSKNPLNQPFWPKISGWSGQYLRR